MKHYRVGNMKGFAKYIPLKMVIMFQYFTIIMNPLTSSNKYNIINTIFPPTLKVDCCNFFSRISPVDLQPIAKEYLHACDPDTWLDFEVIISLEPIQYENTLSVLYLD